jgi:predicted nucleotidyltransferase
MKHKPAPRQAFFVEGLCYNQNMDMQSIGVTQSQIKAFCQEYHIRSLAFFGSVVREDFGPHSDIDVLVEFEPGHIPGYDLFLIEAELSRLMGRKVDLQTAPFLSPEIRQSALDEAITAYEQA